jgi:hypothetical protein
MVHFKGNKVVEEFSFSSEMNHRAASLSFLPPSSMRSWGSYSAIQGIALCTIGSRMPGISVC